MPCATRAHSSTARGFGNATCGPLSKQYLTWLFAEFSCTLLPCLKSGVPRTGILCEGTTMYPTAMLDGVIHWTQLGTGLVLLIYSKMHHTSVQIFTQGVSNSGFHGCHLSRVRCCVPALIKIRFFRCQKETFVAIGRATEEMGCLARNRWAHVVCFPLALAAIDAFRTLLGTCANSG